MSIQTTALTDRTSTHDEKELNVVRQSTYEPHTGSVDATPSSQERLRYLKRYFTTRQGLIGDHDYLYLITPNIWPLNRKYKNYQRPFYGLNNEVPLLLTLILGLQHALCMVGSIVSPPLAIAGGAFNFDTKTTEYLVSASFITTGIATALQVTRIHIAKTPFFIGTGLLSVVGPTFDILAVAINYASLKYGDETCPTSEDGIQLPCPAAWGAVLDRYCALYGSRF